MPRTRDNGMFNCSDGIIRTMEEIGILSEKGIKVDIICKSRNKNYTRWQEWRMGYSPEDIKRLRFPTKLEGSKQWCET